jgi:hypothetical protein
MLEANNNMVSGRKMMRRVTCNQVGDGSGEGDETEGFNI